MSQASDKRYMQYALQLAERELGRTWPNPAVGAVIVKEDAIIGCGATARGGRPHGEPIALAQAGAHAKDATLYVTLEPCSHQGKTPPCVGAIIAAGIKRVVAACADPNPLVGGKGFAALRAAGVEVVENICAEEALAQNAGFFSLITRGRPLVTLKLATSLDGKIATQTGESKWITGENARIRGHLLRAAHDAIITGMGTLLADDPSLTCRIPGREGDSPKRVIMDREFSIPPQAKILPAWVFTSENALQANPEKAESFSKAGTRIFSAPMKEDHLALENVVAQLAREGITRLLVEAGNGLASAFIDAHLVDSIYWFRASLIIGENGLSALRSGSLKERFSLCKTKRLGQDMLEIYNRKAD